MGAVGEVDPTSDVLVNPVGRKNSVIRALFAERFFPGPDALCAGTPGADVCVAPPSPSHLCRAAPFSSRGFRVVIVSVGTYAALPSSGPSYSLTVRL